MWTLWKRPLSKFGHAELAHVDPQGRIGHYRVLVPYGFVEEFTGTRKGETLLRSEGWVRVGHTMTQEQLAVGMNL